MKRTAPDCSVDGCTRATYNKNNVCREHYKQYKEQGLIPRYTRTRSPRHGTASEYTNHKCRCDECKTAWNAYCKTFLDKKRDTWSESDWADFYSDTVELAKLRRKYRPELDSREGVCDCCGRRVNKLVIDHIHGTSTVRGFICPNCNTGIGKLGDNEDGLVMAISYLRNDKNLRPTEI